MRKRSFHKARSKNELGCCVATSRVWKMDTQFLLVETLEKFARALEIPMYQLFYDGEKPPKVLDIPKKSDEKLFGASGKDAEILSKFRRVLGKMDAKNRGILLHTAAKMARPAARQKA